MTAYTLLSISGISIPDNAARACTMTIEPIEGQGQLRRDINGTLDDLSATQFRKHRATVTCTDFAPPDFTDVWEGSSHTVTYTEGIGVSSETDDTLVQEMRLIKWQVSRGDWSKDTSWSIELEQV